MNARIDLSKQENIKSEVKKGVAQMAGHGKDDKQNHASKIQAAFQKIKEKRRSEALLQQLPLQMLQQQR